MNNLVHINRFSAKKVESQSGIGILQPTCFSTGFVFFLNYSITVWQRAQSQRTSLEVSESKTYFLLTVPAVAVTINVTTWRGSITIQPFGSRRTEITFLKHFVIALFTTYQEDTAEYVT